MKKILFLTCMMFGLASMAMAQTVNMNNNSNTYFYGAFHTTTISGCPSTALTTFYYDIPDNNSYSTGDLWDENGTGTTANKISGISLNDGSTTFVVDFCSGGTPTTSGFQFISAGTILVTWVINTGTNTVTINLF